MQNLSEKLECLAALGSPNVILVNSDRSIDIAVAILRISFSAIRIWSIAGKTVRPESLLLKLFFYGGIAQGARLSPKVLQSSDNFGTICKGEAYRLDESYPSLSCVRILASQRQVSRRADGVVLKTLAERRWLCGVTLNGKLDRRTDVV